MNEEFENDDIKKGIDEFAKNMPMKRFLEAVKSTSGKQDIAMKFLDEYMAEHPDMSREEALNEVNEAIEEIVEREGELKLEGIESKDNKIEDERDE